MTEEEVKIILLEEMRRTRYWLGTGDGFFRSWGAAFQDAIFGAMQCAFAEGVKSVSRPIIRGMSDALGVAEKIDAGSTLTLSHAKEFFLDGVRFNAGTYELRRVQDDTAETEQPFLSRRP